MKAVLESSPISKRFLRQFVEITIAEVGLKNLNHLVTTVGLTPSATRAEAIKHMNDQAVIETFALLQQALRLYYGRGARGMLLRIGRNLWSKILEQGSIYQKIKLCILRLLSYSFKRRRILMFVADQFGGAEGSATVHLLDVDLMLVDRASAATYGQKSNHPICFVSLGMIQGALAWVTGQEEDVEEIACRATGARVCEFKVRSGGK